MIIGEEKDFAFCKLDQSNQCFYELENDQWSERIGEENLSLYEEIHENEFYRILKDPSRKDPIYRLTNDDLYWGNSYRILKDPSRKDLIYRLTNDALYWGNSSDDKFLIFKGEWRHRKINFNHSRKLLPH